MKRIYVVELMYPEDKTWHPTVGVGIDREDGLRELKDWQERNPSDKFRLSQYERLTP